MEGSHELDSILLEKQPDTQFEAPPSPWLKCFAVIDFDLEYGQSLFSKIQFI